MSILLNVTFRLHIRFFQFCSGKKWKTDYYWIYANNSIPWKGSLLHMNFWTQWDSDVIFKIFILVYINRMVLKCRFYCNCGEAGRSEEDCHLNGSLPPVLRRGGGRPYWQGHTEKRQGGLETERGEGNSSRSLYYGFHREGKQGKLV